LQPEELLLLGANFDRLVDDFFAGPEAAVQAQGGVPSLSIRSPDEKRTALPLQEMFHCPRLAQSLGQPCHFPSQLLVLVFRSTGLAASLLQPGQQRIE
jgi:hypothetical protein